MGAALGDDSVRDRHNPSGIADGRQPVGDDQRGSALGQVVKGTLNFRLGDGIQRRGGLVQNQDRRVLQENPGNGNPLLLTAGQKCAPLAHIGLKALGHGQNVLVDFRLLCRRDDLLHGGIRPAVADIFQHRIREQKHVLLDDADVLMEAPLGHVPDIQAVNGNAAAGYVVKPGNQLTQGGLSAAGGAYNGDGLPGIYFQTHVVKHRQIPVVGEGHAAHVDFALYVFQLFGILFVPDGRLRAHDLHEAAQPREAVGEELGEIAQLAHGVYKGGNIQIKSNEIPVVHFPAHNIVAAEADDQHVEHTQKEFHAALEHAHGLVEAPLGVLVNLVGGLEPAALRLFVGKGLGGAEAGQAAFDFLVDVSGFLLGNG